MTAMDVLLSFVVAATTLSCDIDRPWPGLEPGLERMLVQPHAAAYQSNATFADDMVMRPIPAGTKAYESPAHRNALPRAHAKDLDRVERIPIPLTRAVLALGRERFTTFCSTCHGILGDGDSAVADRMSLRKPPSLHEPRLRAAAAGHLYAVVSEGFGLMPSYAVELPEADRWAVIAYVRALQLSFAADLRHLSPALRVEAEGQLK